MLLTKFKQSQTASCSMSGLWLLLLSVYVFVVGIVFCAVVVRVNFEIRYGRFSRDVVFAVVSFDRDEWLN